MTLRSGYPVGADLVHPVRISQANKGGGIPVTNGVADLLPAWLVGTTFIDPATIDDDGFSAAHAGADAAGTTFQTLGGDLTSGGVGTQPDGYARNVVITVTHDTSVVAMSGVITGTDLYGKTITEAWSVTATGTSKVFTGLKGFRTITSITEVVAADASANTIKTGNGKTFGLPFPNNGSLLPIGETQDLTTPTAGALALASSASTADARGTYTPNATLDGAKDFRFWWICNDPAGTGN